MEDCTPWQRKAGNVTWKAEQEKPIVEREQLDMEYKQLKADTAAVEKIRSNIYDIVRAERRRTEPQRT